MQDFRVTFTFKGENKKAVARGWWELLAILKDIDKHYMANEVSDIKITEIK